MIEGIEVIVTELVTQSPVYAVLFLMWRREAQRSDRLENRLVERANRDDEEYSELVKMIARKFDQQSDRNS